MVMKIKWRPALSAFLFPVVFGGFQSVQAQIKPSQWVLLEVAGGFNGGCEGPASLDFTQTKDDGNFKQGTAASGAYRVPKGKVLVITDVDWQYVHPNGAAASGQAMTLRLMIQNLDGSDIFGRRAFESTVTLSKLGEGGTSEHMTTGIMISSKARVCPDVSPGPEGPPSGLQHLLLRGYLVNDN